MLSYILIILLIWSLYLMREAGDHDKKFETRMHRAWRRLVFWGGDIRRIQHFPWITWDVTQHYIEYEEALQALKYIRAGDIGLHRDRGFLSNWAIPGFMKHAWIHLNGPVVWDDDTQHYDTNNMKIVEAVSEGVLRRSALYPIRSDYVIILRPKNVSAFDVERAVKKAQKIVGCQYDADFEFDIEDEIKIFEKESKNLGDTLKPETIAEDRQELNIATTNIKAEWDGGFSCTEIASFCWWHKRRQLGLFRKKARGKMVIIADDMINDHFEIVWMSKSVTVEEAKRLGLSEQGLMLIQDYLKTHN